MLSCECCKKTFCRKQSLDRHNTSKLHEIRSSSNVKTYTCDCGQSYLHQPSLRNHKMKCSYGRVVVDVAATAPTPPPPSEVENPIEVMQKKLVVYEKERINQNILVESMQKKIDDQKANIIEIQQKFNLQQKNIESIQQKIDLIAILLQKDARQHESTSTRDNSQSLVTQQPQFEKSRDKRKKINKDVRQHVVDKQENACGMCKLTLTPYFEIDHIIGLQFGGTDDEANLMALCRECHAKKSITENQCRPQIKDAIQTILREKIRY